MIYIAHRGNIAGPNPEFENSVEYIQSALAQGYDCEIDVWYDHDRKWGWFLGHDYPQYPIYSQFLATPRLWIHCKNDKALYQMSKHVHSQFQYFWHQEDDYTLTSRNNIWCLPNKEISYRNRSIAIVVMPEVHNQDVKGYGGICSDYVEAYKNGSN